MHEIIRTYQHHNNQLASIVRVQCDTDFVGRNKEFLQFVDNLAMGVASLDDPWGNLHYEVNPVTDQIFMMDIIDARKSLEKISVGWNIWFIRFMKKIKLLKKMQRMNLKQLY